MKLKTLIFADLVMKDATSNKWSAIGIFNKIYSPVFPSVLKNIDLYIEIDVEAGKYDIEVKFCDKDNCQLAIFEGVKLVIQSKDEKIGFGLKTINLPLEKEGKYFFQIYLNKKYIGASSIVIKKAKK